MKKSVYIPKAHIDETLATPDSEGKKLLEPLKSFSGGSGCPINILENKNKTNQSEVHVREADLWICISGNPIFTVGGTMVNGKQKVRKDGTVDENEILGDSIEGGETYTLSPGDILYIPAGEPHMHSAEDTARLYIIKIKES